MKEGGSKATGYLADCCSNPDSKGNFFSWIFVVNNKDQLCPDGWRVPTTEEFIALNNFFGGSSNVDGWGYANADLRDKYVDLWGGLYNGSCNEVGRLNAQGSNAYYWSQSTKSANYGFASCFDKNGWVTYTGSEKMYGYMLRCVR